MTPILGALIGIVATLIIVAVVIVFIVRTRERDEGTPNGSASKLSVGGGSAAASKSISQLNAEQPGTPGSQSVNKRDPTSELVLHDDEHNPDVVPNKNGILLDLTTFFMTSNLVVAISRQQTRPISSSDDIVVYTAESQSI